MKQGKLEGMIKSVKIENRMGAGNIERCMKEIKEKAQNDDPRNIAMFMPGKSKKSCRRLLTGRISSSEQLDMLKCLMRNEEE